MAVRRGRKGGLMILCHVLGHRRSRRKARITGGEWHSLCLFCREPMVRIGPKDWRLGRKGEEPASPFGKLDEG